MKEKMNLEDSIVLMEKEEVGTLINQLTGGDYEYLFQYMKQIAALLRAGQEMRKADHIYARAEAFEAWDAAIKGNEDE